MTNIYRKICIIIRISIGDKIIDHLDVVHHHSRPKTWLRLIGQRQLQDERETFKFLDLVRLLSKV